MPVRLVFVALILALQYMSLFVEHQASYTEIRNTLAVSAIILKSHTDTRVIKHERNEYRLSDVASDVGKSVPEVNC